MRSLEADHGDLLFTGHYLIPEEIGTHSEELELNSWPYRFYFIYLVFNCYVIERCHRN
jgi:hypothetical protein